jgi:hypothetical protein
MSIAELSVITTGVVSVVVGVGAPALSERFTRRRELWSAREARVAELRSVLDEAAIAARDARYALPGARLFTDQGTLLGDDADRGLAYEKQLDVAAGELHRAVAMLARLGVRLGASDPIFLSYKTVLQRLEDVHGAVRRIKAGELESEQSIAETIGNALFAVERAMDSFFEAASARIHVGDSAANRSRQASETPSEEVERTGRLPWIS